MMKIDVGKIKRTPDIFRRSFFLYIIVYLTFLVIVDTKITQRQISYHLWGMFYRENFTNFKDGVLYYDSLLSQNPKDADLHAMLGHMYFKLKEYPEAVAAYKKAIALKPDFFPFKQNLAVIYATAGQTKKAEDLLRISQ